MKVADILPLLVEASFGKENLEVPAGPRLRKFPEIHSAGQNPTEKTAVQKLEADLASLMKGESDDAKPMRLHRKALSYATKLMVPFVIYYPCTCHHLAAILLCTTVLIQWFFALRLRNQRTCA